MGFKARAKQAGGKAREGACGGSGQLTPFDPVAVWWLDQRFARSAK